MGTTAQAATVFCTNCSQMWTQQMERITNLEQLKNTIDTYKESIMQTQQQIQMVANQIKQYENMIQNTINLPQNVLNEMKGQFSELAKLTQNLKLQKGDYMAMGQVFDNIYPGLDIIKGLASGDAAKSVTEVWDMWSQEVDRAAQATFQVTGSQLKDLAENSDALDNHISKLLGTPEGQMQAIQSGNALAAVQIDEMRKLRMLMATSVQMSTQMAMKDEKRKQLSKEQIDHMMDTTGIKKQYQGYMD
jgi:P-type conjugative transfer protein TrbJ